jgi:3-deoxy-D-manno-octulosonic-acid transferase
MIFAPHVVYDTCLMTALAGLGSYMASRAHIARKYSLKDSKRYIGTKQSCTKKQLFILHCTTVEEVHS